MEQATGRGWRILWVGLFFDSGVLGRIFRPQKEEVTGEWGKLHSEELYDVYWQREVGKMFWAGSVECVGEKRDVCTALCVILKERSEIHFETVPSFIKAEVRMPRRLPCDVACIRSITTHDSNIATPRGTWKQKQCLQHGRQAAHRVRNSGSGCQVQCYPVRQSHQERKVLYMLPACVF